MLELVDSRRLTGPNLLWERPGAVIDVRYGDTNPERLISAWQRQVHRMLDAVGWSLERTCTRRHADGVSLAISAPRDLLYAATEINESAWATTAAELAGSSLPDFDATLAHIREAIKKESNPALPILLEAANARGLPCLIDDDEVSVGLGKGSQVWSTQALPDPDHVDWPSLHAIPVGLITGTNGKTTSVRLVGAMARAAGLKVGISSTDWIAVNDDILDSGDYSGPTGARTVLRDPRVDLAILETARGGLLRRGLAIERASAALITNVAEDHLGEFALSNLDELADLKWVVTGALGTSGHLVLNAEDPFLVKRGATSTCRITWFSPNRDNHIVRDRIANDGTACTVEDNFLVSYDAGQRQQLLPITDIPITLEGAATHNITNALGAVALGQRLGLPIEAITAGLRRTRDIDNPGRCNIYNVKGARVLVDFAHNPHGMEAVFALASNLPAERKLLLIGQAGDRSDDAIRKLVRTAWELRPARIIVKEMARYARGREKGEVPQIIREEFLRLGAPTEMLSYQDEELQAVREAVEWACAGDLLVLLIHENVQAVLDYLKSLNSR